MRMGTGVLALLLAGLLFAWTTCSAQNLRFAVRTIDSEGASPACAVIDVDGDGRLDIVSGGFWYAPPKNGLGGSWKKHFAREVTQIRGRLDEYSLLPTDLNGDAFTDLIVCNYRSKSIQFLLHPGEAIRANPEAPWTLIEFDRPGASETGRLVDLDGDGLLDLLPNGVDYAAWWRRNSLKGGDVKSLFERRELPRELAAHGIGAGDLDGDGRIDLITPAGWRRQVNLESSGEIVWKQEPEFLLHRDGSIPVLVHDVDADGDADLIWARAHGVGLYWLEQMKGEHGRTWRRHVIDTEISQSHSLLLGDLDGDGRAEIVAGSRVLAHDGKDLGEYDELIVAAYKFQPDVRTWRRTILARGFPGEGGVGMGLDPKLADVDGDGDLDLVAADRKGLFLLENLGRGDGPLPASAQREAKLRPQVMLEYVDDVGAIRPVENAEQWGRRRAEILASMQEVMGELPSPDRRSPLDVHVLESVDLDRYARKKISFVPEPGDRVIAYLLIPKDLAAPAPAMLCLHQTTPAGKDSPAGLEGRPTLHYGHELAQRGYVCLIPDYPSFGEYPYEFSVDRGYVSGTMKGVWNHHRAVDLLESLPEVDPDRIGAIGHSLGGHNALFVAAFDRRIKAVITSCGFNAFAHYYGGDLKGWTSPRYMPRIASQFHSSPKAMPFDFHGVLSAIAPRAIYVCAPLHDANFAVEGVREATDEARKVYALLGAKDRLLVEHPDAEHDFPDASRRAAYAWLDAILKR